MLGTKSGWLYVTRISYPRAIVILSVSEGIFCVYLEYILYIIWNAQFLFTLPGMLNFGGVCGVVVTVVGKCYVKPSSNLWLPSQLRLYNTLTALLQWDKTSPVSVLDIRIKKYGGEVPIMLILWGMRSTPSLPLLPGSLWPGMVALDWSLSMG